MTADDRERLEQFSPAGTGATLLKSGPRPADGPTAPWIVSAHAPLARPDPLSTPRGPDPLGAPVSAAPSGGRRSQHHTTRAPDASCGRDAIARRDLLTSAKPAASRRGRRGRTTMSNLILRSLDTITLEEARTYIDAARGDELDAALLLATDRNVLAGSSDMPDDTEVHHALFLLRRARGLQAPSFDELRVELRQRAA